VDPLVRTYGAEVGVRTTRIRDLQSTFSFWYLDIDSELLFVGDAGTTEASRPSRRYGVELANYWTPTDWLTLDLDVSLSHARFRDDPRDPITGQKIGDQIPGSIESVVAAGATLHDWNGLVTGLRLRYFGERPLIEDDSVRSDDTLLLSALVGYRLNETWTLEGEVYNLLDRDDSEIDYFYESRLPGESAGVEDVHFHPVYPRSFRLALMARF
jgi:outer membrane receptor protein involved in Fe transport